MTKRGRQGNVLPEAQGAEVRKSSQTIILFIRIGRQRCKAKVCRPSYLLLVTLLRRICYIFVAKFITRHQQSRLTPRKCLGHQAKRGELGLGTGLDLCIFAASHELRHRYNLVETSRKLGYERNTRHKEWRQHRRRFFDERKRNLRGLCTRVKLTPSLLMPNHSTL